MTKKFQTLKRWIPRILFVIKKEIRTEYLTGNPLFARTYFGNRPLNRVTNEEIFLACEKELLAGDESFAEWVVNRWVFKHGDLYSHFAERLEQITQDFTTLQELSIEQSSLVLQGAYECFGALDVYLFAILNQVVFPKAILQKMHNDAEQAEAQEQASIVEREQAEATEKTIAGYQQQILRLQEKHEQKVAGVMKKYSTDVEALKKQIRSLQQQLQKQRTASAAAFNQSE